MGARIGSASIVGLFAFILVGIIGVIMAIFIAFIISVIFKETGIVISVVDAIIGVVAIIMWRAMLVG